MVLTAPEAHRAAAHEWHGVLDALAGLDPHDAAGGWATPTRCAGWTLLDLARHAVWGTSMEADALRRARTGTSGTAQGTELDADAAASDVLSALRTSVDALVDELAGAAALAADCVLEIPFGTVPLGFGLDVFTMEAGIHADDVADALGHSAALSDEVVTATAAVLAPVLPALAALAGDAVHRPREGSAVAVSGPTVALAFAVRDGAWVPGRVEDPGAARVRADDDSTALRFVLGRLDAADPRLTVTGGAEAFKTWFPGP